VQNETGGTVPAPSRFDTVHYETGGTVPAPSRIDRVHYETLVVPYQHPHGLIQCIMKLVVLYQHLHGLIKCITKLSWYRTSTLTLYQKPLSRAVPYFTPQINEAGISFWHAQTTVGRAADSRIIRKFKWLLVSGCECDGRLVAVSEWL
jgi:hypothetical protein